MISNHLLLVPDIYFKNSYTIELPFKKLIILESIYGETMMLLQSYSSSKLIKTVILIIISITFIITIFCYIIMNACYQYLNGETYITNINKVDINSNLKKKRIYISISEDKNKSNKKIEHREKKNMLDLSKKQIFNLIKVLNITNNQQQIQKLINSDQISLPIYNTNITMKIITYMTILPIIIIKNIIYILSKL